MHFMMACITVTWQQFEMGREQVCCFCMHVVKSQSITWERVKDDGHYDNLWAVCISHPQMRWAVHHRYMSETCPGMNAYLWVPLDNSTTLVRLVLFDSSCSHRKALQVILLLQCNVAR